MRKQIFYAVMMALLLVACTTKNEPSVMKEKVHRIQGNGMNVASDEFED